MSTTNGSDVHLPTLTARDFTSDQDVRWCPGCGDYAVLNGIRKALPKAGHKKEDFVFVSGIGCAARFPYYMDTYGLHTIHGRALAFGTGVKLANPELQVCVVSGDGDLLSIGGNHTVHTIRRNVDMTIVLLNNRIYGLTKGQYSPTSEVGKVTKSTPMGSLDTPINPLGLVAACGCRFIARAIDVDTKLFESIYTRALGHRGTSFIEVYQDCNIFNHEAFFYASQKDTRPENTVLLEHGKPMIFGTDHDKGIRLVGGTLEKFTIGQDGSADDALVHDETNANLAYLLTQMAHPDLPEPVGVLYAAADAPTYDGMVEQQMQAARANPRAGSLADLISGGETWEVGQG